VPLACDACPVHRPLGPAPSGAGVHTCAGHPSHRPARAPAANGRTARTGRCRRLRCGAGWRYSACASQEFLARGPTCALCGNPGATACDKRSKAARRGCPLEGRVGHRVSMPLDRRGADRAMSPCLGDGLRRSHAVGCLNSCRPCPGARARGCADRQRTGGPLCPWHVMPALCTGHRVPRLRARVRMVAHGTRCTALPSRRPPTDGRPAPAFAGRCVAVHGNATQHVLGSVAWRGAQRVPCAATPAPPLATSAPRRPAGVVRSRAGLGTAFRCPWTGEAMTVR
jgi:hypothetical protein